MKRFVLLAMLAMTWWCVPAFGAESIRILRNGEEVRLSQGILRQDGTLMMSIQDLAELTESELRQDGSVTAFGYRLKEGPVVLENEQTATLVEDVVLYDHLGRKIPIAGKVLRKDGEIYLPARTIANALGYTVKWSRMDGAETFSVERPVMPRVTLDVVYDKEEQRVTGTIWNREPQTFDYGDDFLVERMTAEGWERMREAEPKYIDGIGYSMSGLWEGLLDGKWTYSRRLYCALPAGKYRIGIPFFFRYEGTMSEESLRKYLWETHGVYTMEDMKKLLQEDIVEYQKGKTPDDLWKLWSSLEIIYSTQWGNMAFYFAGADSKPEYSTSTYYVLYGEFEVE